MLSHTCIGCPINVDYTMTRTSDHSSLIISIGTNIENQLKGTFRAPQELIKEGIKLSQIRCKQDSDLKKVMENLIVTINCLRKKLQNMEKQPSVHH